MRQSRCEHEISTLPSLACVACPTCTLVSCDFTAEITVRSVRILQADWQADTNGSEFVEYPQFFKSMYELIGE
jgi:hypothetical protein